MRMRVLTHQSLDYFASKRVSLQILTAMKEMEKKIAKRNMDLTKNSIKADMLSSELMHGLTALKRYSQGLKQMTSIGDLGI